MSLARVREYLRDRRRSNDADLPREDHLAAAMDWLRAAQDAHDDGGVSHSYLVGQGWMRSYPETTGYILPTFLNWARLREDEDAVARARRMADWELDCQSEEGAIPELVSGRPTVFDTGQVIFGWLAAHQHTGDDRYLEAARRGGRWLLEELDSEGVWRHASDSGGPGRVYNARVAWALLLLGDRTGKSGYRAPMQRFLEWTLAQEKAPGWFDRNCLTDDSAPLLHTIAYTARGHLESGLLLEDERLLESSRRTAQRVLRLVGPEGRLAGRFDAEWRPAVDWACLTGMAQMAIVWRRLAEIDAGEAEGPSPDELLEGARRVTGYLCRIQDLDSGDPGLRGGIRGSQPIRGAYGRWRVLNWATKFFVDALLLEESSEALHHPG